MTEARPGSSAPTQHSVPGSPDTQPLGTPRTWRHQPTLSECGELALPTGGQQVRWGWSNLRRRRRGGRRDSGVSEGRINFPPEPVCGLGHETGQVLPLVPRVPGSTAKGREAWPALEGAGHESWSSGQHLSSSFVGLGGRPARMRPTAPAAPPMAPSHRHPSCRPLP